MRVGIVGTGQTKFGKLSDSSSRELVADACKEADSGLARKDISALAVCSGTHYDKQRSPAGIMGPNAESADTFSSLQGLTALGAYRAISNGAQYQGNALS